jgi:Domain of unknown function (DUF4352)
MTIPQKTPWYDKKIWVILWCIFFFPVGLYGLWKSSTIGIVWKVLVSIVIVAIVFGRGSGNNTASNSNNSNNNSANVQVEEPKQSEPAQVVEEKPKSIGMNQVLQTDYFEVTVNGIEVANTVGSGFAEQQAGDGNKFLILDVTYKNIDTESRWITGDHVYVTYNGKEYDFSKQEVVLQEGYGVSLEVLNPLTTKTAKIVYKIPSELTGEAFYQPSRAKRDQLVALGTLR